MSSSPFVLGADVGSSSGDPRYFYALRREEDGTLFVSRSDLQANDSVEVFKDLPIPPEFNEMEFPGDDYYTGRSDATHELTYTTDKVKYEQWRWDSRLLSYTLDDEGFLVLNIGQDTMDLISN